ncbi:MAG: hypothetical protein JWO12_2573 [Frankiales bacterium]|nr:hypothetical protein [Frankiales bacterium]
MTTGWLLAPQAVPIYDGVGQPDEPYRYVAAPAGAPKTAPATSGTATSPLSGGRNTNGMSVQTAEMGPQASLFVPPQALAAGKGDVTVTTTPKAAADQPAGAVIDGNVYAISVVSSSGGPVTLTDQAAIATLYLRSTTAKQPGPVMEYRAAAAAPWKQLKTSRGGTDIYVSSFVGAGDYALAFVASSAKASKGSSPLLYILLGVGALLVLVIVAVRRRSGATDTR